MGPEVNPGTLIRIPIMFEQGRHSDCGIGGLFGVFMKDPGYTSNERKNRTVIPLQSVLLIIAMVKETKTSETYVEQSQWKPNSGIESARAG